MNDEIWTLLRLIRWTTDYFQKNNIENPRLNVEYLIGKITQLERVDLYMNYDRIVSKKELSDFKELIKRRIAGEPLQYIIGETSFYGYPIKVGPGVLIPRPETELLVEKIISDLKDKEPGSIADIGTGSGCIAIALALELPGWNIYATDISLKALAMAEENARINEVENRIQFIQHDINNNLLPKDLKVDVLVSNPPYVSLDEYSQLPEEIKNFEPPEALLDGNDGLSFYRKILSFAPNIINNGIGTVYFELGHQSIDSGVDLIAKEMGYNQIEIVNDYAQINRIMKVNYEKREVQRTEKI